jgi:DNA-binding beta-propeller fold protein YncE
MTWISLSKFKLSPLPLFIIFLISAGTIGPAYGQTLVASLTLNSGQAHLRVAAIDTVHGFAYFGNVGAIDSKPSVVVKVSLSTFSVVGVLTTSSNDISSLLVDPANGFLYVGDKNSGNVTKVDLSTFTIVGQLFVAPGLELGVIDTIHGFAYYGDQGDEIFKVRLSDFSLVGTLFHLPIFFSISAAIDPAGGFAYFGGLSNRSPQVVQIRLSDFTVAGTLSLKNASDESRQPSTLLVDPVNEFLYVGTISSPGLVFKIHLPDLKQVGLLKLPNGQVDPLGSVIDTPRGFAYFVTGTSSNTIVKISLSTFTEVGSLQLPSGDSFDFFADIIDTTAGFAYFGTYSSPSPAVIVKIGP